MQSQIIILKWFHLLMVSLFVISSKCESNNGIFETSDFWAVIDKPIIANGHVGYVPYADSVFMNGLYNGLKDKSHRARVPNFANIQFEPCTQSSVNNVFDTDACFYALDIYNGVFRTRMQSNDGVFGVEQLQYAHRYYDTAIINHIRLQRNQATNNDTLKLRMFQNTEFDSEDLTVKISKSVKILGKSVVIIEASTKVLEDSKYQHELSTVSILYEQVPSIIELLPGQMEAECIFITIVQENSTDIVETFKHLHKNQENILKSHSDEWQTFWATKKISAEGNEELTNAIDASIFALASSLPSLNTSRQRPSFYGLSPSGLGLEGEVYQGHSFWDTEVWMQPTILLLEPKWSKSLLDYRHLMRNTAVDNAKNTSYSGYRYPWESAFTGIDVTKAEFPQIIEYQQHVTADIGHALRKHFYATRDLGWFEAIGCDLAYGTADFWQSRVAWNDSTKRYDINGVMGPDEDHYNISNNAYTNVVAALDLHFGTYASCICNHLDPVKYPYKSEYSSIAKQVTLLYDSQLDYHPQYDGYDLSVPIKQADVALLGYPLQFATIRSSTRKNNLNFYANLTREDGPAMTWSMHAIGHLEVDSNASDELFNRTFIPYIRYPYLVWNEFVNGVSGGASNFITGAGGFLQLIMYGYAGIRINADSLTIQKASLPPNTIKLTLNGISYLNTRFELQLGESVRVNIIENRDILDVFIDDIQQDPAQKSYELNYKQTLKLKPKGSNIDNCSLPEDTVDELDIHRVTFS